MPGQSWLRLPQHGGCLLPALASVPGAGSAFGHGQRVLAQAGLCPPPAAHPPAPRCRWQPWAGAGRERHPRPFHKCLISQWRPGALQRTINLSPGSEPGVPPHPQPHGSSPTIRPEKRGWGGPNRATISGCFPMGIPRGVRGHPGPSDPICVLFKGPFMFLLYMAIKLAFTLEPVPGVCWCVRLGGAQGAASMALCHGGWHPHCARVTSVPDDILSAREGRRTPATANVFPEPRRALLALLEIRSSVPPVTLPSPSINEHTAAQVTVTALVPKLRRAGTMWGGLWGPCSAPIPPVLTGPGNHVAHRTGTTVAMRDKPWCPHGPHKGCGIHSSHMPVCRYLFPTRCHGG